MEYYSQATENLLNRLKSVHIILEKLLFLRNEPKNLKAKAKKEREAAESAKKNRWIVPQIKCLRLDFFFFYGYNIFKRAFCSYCFVPHSEFNAHIRARHCKVFQTSDTE